MTRGRFFPIGDAWLVVQPRGLTGAYALMCALGLQVLPAAVETALDRAEWVDIVAKTRGMYVTNPDLLYRFPVCRQHCGCRVMFEEMPGHALLLARFIVRLCETHPWSVDALVEALGPTCIERELVTADGALILGHLSRSAS